MDIEPAYLLYGVIFLTVLLLVEGAYYFFVESAMAKRRTNRRISLLNSGMQNREVLEMLRRNPTGETGAMNALTHPLAYLDALIAQSGLPTTRLRMAMIMLSVTVAALVALQAAQHFGRLPTVLWPLHIQAALALFLGIMLPIFYLTRAGAARKRKFGQQLPDALDIMVRSLRAGHPINAAMGLVAREMSDPMGTEFGIAVDEMTYGLEMTEALENLNDRVQVEEFNYVVMSIGIQNETGGNLAGVLASLSHVIRERARMFLKVRSLSSEGRMSALVLCALPFVVGGFIFAGNPGYYTNAVGDPLFAPILGIAFFNLMMGIFMIYRMVNFRF
jgi:tight adherence protein B